ncbi:intradiol ring-cleavage dioxygenase [Sphingobium aquiterrae]|uniref:intradiol ring-cleavage dioxygenase n=1 Tax=Sphingobium aquiterrae TaxID=2038656 RepID=UPI003016F9A8
MNEQQAHAHDLGLSHDLRILAHQQVGRRRTLHLLFSAGTAALVGACGGGSSGTGSASSTASSSTSTSSSSSATSSSSSGTGSTSTTCIADPSETNGPYPADGSNSRNGTVVNVLDDSGIVRTDIRSSFGTSTATATGVYTTLTITLVNVNNSCAPLAGYAIYIWHCTVNGQYSLYDLPSENYLRGVGVTDANGQVTFTTIFPGCYSGRYPHIHFEVYPGVALATSYANRILTSQFAMPADACSTVYATTAYASSRTNFASTTTANDNVFGDNTSAQIATMTPGMTGDITNGFTGTVTVGVAI